MFKWYVNHPLPFRKYTPSFGTPRSPVFEDSTARFLNPHVVCLVRVSGHGAQFLYALGLYVCFCCHICNRGDQI